jgi:hypothetical protein
MFSFKQHTTRVLNLEPWDYSYCISQAAGHQRLAFYWQNRVNDYQYHNRFNMTSSTCSHQADLAAESAVIWYQRAERKR